MTVGSAIGNLFQSVADIIAGIVNAILAVIQTIFATIYGVIKTAVASAEGILKFLWSNLGILLVLGFSILLYQIFVVDKGRAPNLSQKVGAGRKKVA